MMVQASNDLDWISAKDLAGRTQTDLRAYFLREGNKACLNFVLLQRNAGKYYCDADTFEEAQGKGRVLEVKNNEGKTVRVIAVGYKNFDTLINADDLRNGGIIGGLALE
jgi:hypothetical protein